MYRPMNWEEIKETNRQKSHEEDWERGDIFEAGADAMLEALTKDTCKLVEQNGWWVFIPDEE